METTSNTNFRILRAATGLPQTRFADLIGVSLDTIKSIEAGRLRVSERVARKCYLATGCLPDSVLMESGSPRAWTREEYTTAHFMAWQKLINGDILDNTLGGTSRNSFDKVLRAIFAAAEANGRLGTMQAEILFAAFDHLFREGYPHAARIEVHSKGHGEAFAAAARIAGRIEPSEEVAQQ